jgi:hypothetical protein
MAIDRADIERLVRQPGQSTSSHGVPATTATRIVGDHHMSRPAARSRFHRSMTRSLEIGPSFCLPQPDEGCSVHGS